jgi:hypothetical protein
MSVLGVGSLIASLTGSVAFIGDVLTIAGWLGSTNGGLAPDLEVVLSMANVTGFLLGLVSSRAGCLPGAVGLHLSWAPVVAVLIFLAAYRPALAAEIVKHLASLVLDVFSGLAEMITLLM